MSGYPKKVMTFEYKPGKTLVAGVVELKNEVGSLSEATSILAKLGVDLTQSTTYELPTEGKAIWSFIGISGPDPDIQEMQKILSTSSKVLGCNLRKSDRGLLSDTLQFPVITGGDERAILVYPSGLTTMFAQMKTLFGTGGDVLVYEQGLAAGRDGALRLTKEVSRERMAEDDADTIGIYSSLGWGQVEVLEQASDFSRIVLSIKDNFEAVGVKAKSPNCQFVRGVAAGWYSVIAERSLSCNETECIAAGAPACKFILS